MKFGLYHAMGELETLPLYEHESPPLGLLYIASFIEKKLGFSDFILETQDISRLMEIKPDIIGISSLSVYFSKAIEAAREVKNKLHIPVIIGGPHISILPHTLPEVFDIGVIGEGEETALELLKLYMEEGKFSSERLNKINGIVYHGEKGPVITQPRELIPVLDDIPFPKRELFQNLFINPVATLITSRGCPYKCTFCSPCRYWKKFRFFSSDYVKKELVHMLPGLDGIPVITVADDTFVINSRRFQDIHSFILANKINEEIEFEVSIKADMFSEELCRMLKNMNVTKVFFGIESGSQRMLDYYQKAQTVEDAQRVLDLCAKYGMPVSASFLTGAPVETKEDMEATYRFIDKNYEKIFHCSVIPLLPLPGTYFWDYALKRGLINETGEHIQSGKDLVYMCETMTRKEFDLLLNGLYELIRNKVKKDITKAEKLLLDIKELGI